jgi:hypothetical protein
VQHAPAEIAGTLAGHADAVEQGIELRIGCPRTVDAQLQLVIVAKRSQEAQLIDEERPIQQQRSLGAEGRDQAGLDPTETGTSGEQDEASHCGEQSISPGE